MKDYKKDFAILGTAKELSQIQLMQLKRSISFNMKQDPLQVQKQKTDKSPVENQILAKKMLTKFPYVNINWKKNIEVNLHGKKLDELIRAKGKLSFEQMRGQKKAPIDPTKPISSVY